MNRLTVIVLLVLALASSGCYHAMVTTGLEPGGRVYEKPWALGFVYGLVPPATVDAAAGCPAGVAIVETKLSFLNQLVSGLTFGILTPMHITVTCAASRSTAGLEPAITVPGGDPSGIVNAISAAADLAVETRKPVFVRFD